MNLFKNCLELITGDNDITAVKQRWQYLKYFNAWWGKNVVKAMATENNWKDF